MSLSSSETRLADAARDCVLWCFEDERAAAQRLLEAWPQPAGAPAAPRLAVVARHRFPDGELKLRVPIPVPPRLAIWRGLQQPNEKLVELLLAARTARAHGARHLTLLTPYLGYMRQDMEFEPGEAVSQRIVGDFLAGLFDAVVTVDPHLHRVASLGEAVPVAQPVVLSGAPALADWIAQRRPGALLLGPDEESAQWVAQAAARIGHDSAVCRKLRRGDRSVEISLPEVALRGRRVVILDDVASTGHTVAQAARLLLAAGAASVDVAVTHALFADDAEAVLRAAGVGEIWSTDCIPHASNVATMAPFLARALQALWS
ncbi:MAG: ribose-phosphate diphosphokinase [Pseudomonadota bacterium]|jgi:ribose-phosphate pyrophosphokinase